MIITDRICLGHSPLNMATIAGQPVTMSCGLQSFNGLIRWTFQSVTSREAKFLFNGYNITRGLRKHFINGSQPGEFNLANNDPGLEDAGNYQCIRAIRNEASYRMEYNIAQLTVLCKSIRCMCFYVKPSPSLSTISETLNNEHSKRYGKSGKRKRKSEKPGKWLKTGHQKFWPWKRKFFRKKRHSLSAKNFPSPQTRRQVSATECYSICKSHLRLCQLWCIMFHQINEDSIPF